MLNAARKSQGTLKSGKARATTGSKHIRYAVVGLGHIAQAAVLPGFRHATKNSRLAALVSHDPEKRKQLSRKYKVPVAIGYRDYEKLLRSGDIDAVFIAEPNSLHASFSIRAAKAGVHVLCEKPLAVTEKECKEMIDACQRNEVLLMTAYRLHFERANLEAIEIVQSGKIGDPRYFNSIFSMQTKAGNIRLQKRLGGGTLYDIGIYCINAARYLFRDDPTEALAITANSGEKRFREVEEMTGALLRFPKERVAAFVCSFGATDAATYEVVGTKGMLEMRNGYEYAAPIEMKVTIGGKSRTKTFPKRDQFGAELFYFSDCIRKRRQPEPSGVEGYNDVHIIRSLYESARTGRSVKLKPLRKRVWPSLKQEIRKPAIEEPDEVRAKAPHKD